MAKRAKKAGGPKPIESYDHKEKNRVDNPPALVLPNKSSGADVTASA